MPFAFTPAVPRLPCLIAALPAALSMMPAMCAPATQPAQKLVEQSQHAMRGDPDASRRYAEQALQALAAQPDADLEIRARLQLCDYFSERDSVQAREHIAHARRALPRASRQGLQAGLASCEGEVAQNAGDYAEARILFDQAVQTAEQWDDTEMLAGALYQRGYLRGVQGDYAAGLADLRRANGLYERLHMGAHATTTLNGIATLYNRMGDHGQARHYYEQTLKAQRADGSPREVAVTEHNLGRAYESLQQWDKAREAFTASLELCRSIQYQRGEAYALRGLASVRNAEGEPKDALGLLQLAELLQKRTPDERLRAQILLQRGVALRQLNRLPEAKVALQQALQVFEQVKSSYEIVASRQALAALAAEAADWKTAFEQQRDYTQALQRWLRSQLDQRFATLKVEFDTSAKERENALLLREKAATENALAQAQRAGRLQIVAIALACALLLALGLMVLRQRRNAKEVQRLALTDELTGLPNRRDVLGRLQSQLTDRRGRPCALLIVDLDHFKSVNDSFGHLVGDELLKAVAGALRQAVPPYASLGRLGGEEFVVMLPDADEDQALTIGEAIREQVQTLDPGQWMPGAHQLTASLGVTVSRPGRDSISSILRRADEALYRAKAAGRNRVFAEAEAA